MEVAPLTPVSFFAFQIDCFHLKERFTDKHKLPDLSSFQGEIPFVDLFLGWNLKGISVLLAGSFDALDLFLDTRDRKTTTFPTRFCHHFYFLPDKGEEVTRFRTDDAHELCNPSLLRIQKKTSGRYEIFIPSEALHGFDPDEFDRLGFNYRIHSEGKPTQQFSLDDHDFVPEKHPSLWASLKLKS